MCVCAVCVHNITLPLRISAPFSTFCNLLLLFLDNVQLLASSSSSSSLFLFECTCNEEEEDEEEEEEEEDEGSWFALVPWDTLSLSSLTKDSYSLPTEEVYMKANILMDVMDDVVRRN